MSTLTHPYYTTGIGSPGWPDTLARAARACAPYGTEVPAPVLAAIYADTPYGTDYDALADAINAWPERLTGFTPHQCLVIGALGLGYDEASASKIARVATADGYDVSAADVEAAIADLDTYVHVANRLRSGAYTYQATDEGVALAHILYGECPI